MQDYPVNPTFGQTQPNSSIDELGRIFNSALVSTRIETIRDFSTELCAMIETPAFRAILNSVRQLARHQGISDSEAAEIIIHTFRKIDRIWEEYTLQEGVGRIKDRVT
jgi:hypothetical protein